jgi:hypothetical protein
VRTKINFTGITVSDAFKAASRPTTAWQAASTASPCWSGSAFTDVPHRLWLYGTYLIRGEISVLASPGGVGKIAIADVCCWRLERFLSGARGLRGWLVIFEIQGCLKISFVKNV